MVITYHSLEDRMVKNIMKTGNIEGRRRKKTSFGNVQTPFRLVNNKVIVPDNGNRKQPGREAPNESRKRNEKLKAVIWKNEE